MGFPFDLVTPGERGFLSSASLASALPLSGTEADVQKCGEKLQESVPLQLIARSVSHASRSSH